MFDEQVGLGKNLGKAANFDVAEQPQQCSGIGAAPIAMSPIRARIQQCVRDGDQSMRRLAAAQRAQRVLNNYPEFAELLDALAELGL